MLFQGDPRRLGGVGVIEKLGDAEHHRAGRELKRKPVTTSSSSVA